MRHKSAADVTKAMAASLKQNQKGRFAGTVLLAVLTLSWYSPPMEGAVSVTGEEEGNAGSSLGGMACLGREVGEMLRRGGVFQYNATLYEKRVIKIEPVFRRQFSRLR